MKERERNGVRLGQPVRDLDGKPLGKVIRLWPWGFEARRGLPVFSRGRYVLRYDEIRAVRDGAVVVSRSDRDVFELAAGEVPRSWRIPTPSAFPTAATPSEARSVRDDVAAGRVRGIADGEGEGESESAGVAPPPGAGADREVLTDEALREYVNTRGQAHPPERVANHRA